ncbi:MAG: TRAP transporter small permease subunit [Pseudomonadota bacterium]
MPLRLWRGLLTALAGIAGAIIALMFFFIVLDVTMRSLGYQPPLFTGTFIEFGLLYCTMLAAPWLIGRDGHIRVRALTDRLPAQTVRWLEALIFTVLALLTAVLAWYALDVVLDSAARGEVEYRSIILPRWVLFAPMPPCFLFCAIEFARLAVSGQADHSGTQDAERSL